MKKLLIGCVGLMVLSLTSCSSKDIKIKTKTTMIYKGEKYVCDDIVNDNGVFKDKYKNEYTLSYSIKDGNYDFYPVKVK